MAKLSEQLGTLVGGGSGVCGAGGGAAPAGGAASPAGPGPAEPATGPPAAAAAEPAARDLDKLRTAHTAIVAVYGADSARAQELAAEVEALVVRQREESDNGGVSSCVILGDRKRRMGSIWNEVPRRRWGNGARSRSGRCR